MEIVIIKLLCFECFILLSIWIFVVIIIVNIIKLVLFNIGFGIEMINVLNYGKMFVKMSNIFIMVIMWWFVMFVREIMLIFWVNDENGVVDIIVVKVEFNLLYNILLCKCLFVIFVWVVLFNVKKLLFDFIMVIK